MGGARLRIQKIRLIFAGIIGNIIEYYDFALVGFLAGIIGQLFFPSDNHFLSLLGSLGAFAAGMIMRPLGALFFGYIGDKIDRRYALFGSLALMALPTFLIGFLPTYAQIGIVAPILLVALRMIQGFSVGGEYSSSIVYLVEEAPPGHQNLYGSFVSLGAKLGMGLGSAFYGYLLMVYSPQEMLEWVWRVPFLLSLVLALIGFALRKNLHSDYEAPKSDRFPLAVIWGNYRSLFWSFLLLASAIWIFYYTLFIYLPLWLVEYGNLTKQEIAGLNTFSIVAGALLIPLAAMIADKIGSKKLITISALSTIILIIPIFMLLEIGDLAISYGAVFLMTLLLCSFQAPIFAFTVNAMPDEGIRASFVAIILGSAAGIVGGSTPALMALTTKTTGFSLAPCVLIIILALFTLWRLKKT